MLRYVGIPDAEQLHNLERTKLGTKKILDWAYHYNGLKTEKVFGTIIYDFTTLINFFNFGSMKWEVDLKPRKRKKEFQLLALQQKKIC